MRYRFFPFPQAEGITLFPTSFQTSRYTMPGPGTIFAVGAGMAGAVAFASNRRRRSSNEGREQTNTDKYMSPHAMGRRGSKGVQNDLYEDGRQVCVLCKILAKIYILNYRWSRLNCSGVVIMVPTLAITLMFVSLGSPPLNRSINNLPFYLFFRLDKVYII